MNMNANANVKVFELKGDVESLPVLGPDGFKREGESCTYLCKVTDATIVFIGDNAKFAKGKDKQFNTLTLTLPPEQSQLLKAILVNTGKTNLPCKEYEEQLQFRVKLDPRTKVMDANKKDMKVNLKKVPCTDLREYRNATIDLVLTGESKEFKGKDGEMISYANLTSTQFKIKSSNSLFDCDFL